MIKEIIKNQEEKQDYKNIDKLYIPQEYNNSNYKYRMNGDYITIITNQNCYTNYNTIYCDCYTYNYKLNVMGGYSNCNSASSTLDINYSKITSDINYSERITSYYKIMKSIDLSIILIIILIIIGWRTRK